MSYFTRAEFFYLDDEEFRLDELKATLPSITDASFVSRDVVGDVLELISDGKVLVSVYAQDVIGIFQRIAQSSPDIAFVVRGFGEAPHDVWMREFRNGEPVVELGPPPNAI